MHDTAPYQGHFADAPDGSQRHLFAQRVYFEDTDFSGVVYHARYLHFMERARSDMLALAGIEQRSAHENGQGAYAVTQMTLKFLKPARFDDALLVTSSVEAVRGASVHIHQEISRVDDVLLTAEVIAAFVSPQGRAHRQPKEWIAAFEAIRNKPIEM
jgi:acyl-CoA thioester hydrolase